MILTGEQLTFSVADKHLINAVDIAVSMGCFVAIIGPNGAGKTTLLNLLDGDVKPTVGRVLFEKMNVSTIDSLVLAQQRAVLPQLGHVPFAIKARDIVSLGREPYRYQADNQYNTAVVDYCLAETDVTHLADHRYNTLSGGEQHRVQIARTLAQIHHQPKADLSGKILFLDEPTNHLDIRHQYRLMMTLKSLQQKGLTIIAVMHDLSLTLQYAEQIVLLSEGKKIGSYTPDELVESDALSSVYQMKMSIRKDQQTRRYFLLPAL